MRTEVTHVNQEQARLKYNGLNLKIVALDPADEDGCINYTPQHEHAWVENGHSVLEIYT